MLASEEVQPSTAANRALRALVFIHNHSQACLWNYSSAKLHLTWKYQRTAEYLMKETKLLARLFSEPDIGV